MILEVALGVVLGGIILLLLWFFFVWGLLGGKKNRYIAGGVALLIAYIAFVILVFWGLFLLYGLKAFLFAIPIIWVIVFYKWYDSFDSLDTRRRRIASVAEFGIILGALMIVGSAIIVVMRLFELYL